MISNSEKILRALLKHGRLNTRQIANNISQKTVTTVTLINLMFGNGKLQVDGRIDDLIAYSLTPKGRMAVEKNPLSPHPVTPVAKVDSLPRSLEDLAFPQPDRTTTGSGYQPTGGKMPPPPPSRRVIGSKTTANEPITTFGRLNTGELIFIQGDAQIVLSASLVPQLSELLQGSPA